MKQVPRLGLDPFGPFPPTDNALEEPNGLLAWGGDLHPARLLNAYRQGIFPWSSTGQPILWWSPAPRCVLYPDALHISRRLKRRLARKPFQFSADTAFSEVLDGCAAPAPGRESTWITAELKQAFCQLHTLGHAHSIEAWAEDELVGGLYGLSLGRIFFAESMFHRQPDASKAVLVVLCDWLCQQGFTMIDCQVENPHLQRMGACSIPRRVFEAEIQRSVAETMLTGPWTDAFSA